MIWHKSIDKRLSIHLQTYLTIITVNIHKNCWFSKKNNNTQCNELPIQLFHLCPYVVYLFIHLFKFCKKNKQHLCELLYCKYSQVMTYQIYILHAWILNINIYTVNVKHYEVIIHSITEFISAFSEFEQVQIFCLQNSLTNEEVLNTVS